MLEEAIPAEIETLEFYPEVERIMRCRFKRHYLGALFSIPTKQQRGQAEIEANDAARRQTVKRRDCRSVAAAGTMPQERRAS